MTHRKISLEYVVVSVLHPAVFLAVGLLGAVAGVGAEDVLKLESKRKVNRNINENKMLVT